MIESVGRDHAGVLAALASLPGMGPRRLNLLLAHHDPDEAFAVAAGTHAPHPSVVRHASAEVRSAWAVHAAKLDLDECAAACRAAGVSVIPIGDPRFPPELVVDPSPPAVLFVRGDLGVLDARRVGVVGTRNATASGLATASALGADLAAAGVCVVSGLALGIDAAAHGGAVRVGGPGRPAAVVGNGPDRAYPRRNAALWDQVCDRGVLLSEWPPGTRPDPFRFPLRNRILAALCEVVVVVESREAGGSLSTAREAAERSVQVMAVPGSPRNRAAAGTNRLIADGAAPVRDADDVLVALGLDSRRLDRTAFDPRPVPTGLAADVLARCSQDACTLELVATELGVPLVEAAMALARLERSGWLVEAQGWFEVVGPPVRVP